MEACTKILVLSADKNFLIREILQLLKKCGFTNGSHSLFHVQIIVKNNTYVAASVRGIHNLTINRCEREELRDWTILRSYDQKLCLVTIKFKFVQRHSCHNTM